MHILETDYPYGVNELEKAGLTEEPAKKVKPPRVMGLSAGSNAKSKRQCFAQDMKIAKYKRAYG